MGLAESGIMPPMKYWEVIADKLSAAGAPLALLVFVAASAFAKSPAPEVIFTSPCECQGFHGKNRWIAKTDLTPVPLDKSAIQSVTPLGPIKDAFARLRVFPGLDAVFGAPTFRRRIRGQTTNQEAVPQELNTLAQSGSGECPRN